MKPPVSSSVGDKIKETDKEIQGQQACANDSLSKSTQTTQSITTAPRKANAYDQTAKSRPCKLNNINNQSAATSKNDQTPNKKVTVVAGDSILNKTPAEAFTPPADEK